MSNVMQRSLFEPEIGMEEIAPGALLLRGWLSADEQRALAAVCLEAGSRPAGFYRPVHVSGHPLHIRYFCFGWHWSPLTYTYSVVRTDTDGLPVQPLPPQLDRLGRRAAAEAGMELEPDLALINLYDAEGRLGLHRDKDEDPGTLARGVPVVSVSLGETAEFLFGGARRADARRTLMLRSGDVFVFGGPSRLHYHGVRAIVPGSGPPDLGFAGRLNITIRESGLGPASARMHGRGPC